MIRWWRRRRLAVPDDPAPAFKQISVRSVHLQFDMRVINRTLPVEIEGTCNQRPFYYRARGGIWRIFGHVVDSVGDEPPFASGECDIDEQTDLVFAVARICEHIIQPALDR